MHEVASPWETREPKLADRLYGEILDRIIRGVYAPGTRLPGELTLSEEFQVSRPVVREALARLRDDDLVQSRQGAGTFVKRQPHRAVLRFAPVSSIGDLQRCLEFRAAVEPRAAALAAARHDEAGLAAIEAAAERLEAVTFAGEVGAEADLDLHLAIAEAGANRYFTETLALLREQIGFGMRLVRNLSLRRPSRWREQVIAEHRAILAAIRARDAAGAEAAMARHIQNTRERMFEGEISDEE